MNNEMTDKEIVDWIQAHLTDLIAPLSGGVKITWWKRGKEQNTTGYDLRDAVTKAAGKTAVSDPPHLCPNCGDDRTGKGSLIVGGKAFCNENCYDSWLNKTVISEE